MALSERSKSKGRSTDPSMPAWFYMLRLRSGRLYPGATTDLERRWREHLEGKACRTTERDPPVELAHSESFPTFVQARRRESQVKRWSRAKKEALVAGDRARLKALAKRRHSTDAGRP